MIYALNFIFKDHYSVTVDEMGPIMDRHGFVSYVDGDDKMVWFGSVANAVDCVLVVQDLSRSLPRFSEGVQQAMMLRIESVESLIPAIKHV